jgi:hypothetical protein
VVITGRLIPAGQAPPGLSPQRRRGRPAVTVAKPTDKAHPVRTTVECPSSARTATDGPGRGARSDGAEGWGFESLRARPPSAPRSTASEPGCELILYGACLALTVGSRDTPGGLSRVRAIGNHDRMGDTETSLRAENAELRRLLEKHQWAGLTPVKSSGCCPECCGPSPPHGSGHRPGCAIAVILAITAPLPNDL